MNTKEEQMRAEFEHTFTKLWAVEPSKRIGPYYASDDWECAWIGYQAALTSMSAKSVPEGYAIVPIEPTDEMVNAYVKYVDESPYKPPYETSIKGRYQAMLAAAPQPPQEDRVREFGSILTDALEYSSCLLGEWSWKKGERAGNAEEYMELENYIEALSKAIAAMKEPTLEGEEG